MLPADHLLASNIFNSVEDANRRAINYMSFDALTGRNRRVNINYLIENNTHRIDKILKATRGLGESICCYQADNEQIESGIVIDKIKKLAIIKDLKI